MTFMPQWLRDVQMLTTDQHMLALNVWEMLHAVEQTRDDWLSSLHELRKIFPGWLHLGPWISAHVAFKRDLKANGMLWLRACASQNFRKAT